MENELWRKNISDLSNGYLCHLCFEVEPLLIHKMVPKVLGYKEKSKQDLWQISEEENWGSPPASNRILTEESVPFHYSCLSAFNFPLFIVIRHFSFGQFYEYSSGSEFGGLNCKMELH